jgi:hypothetical protein
MRSSFQNTYGYIVTLPDRFYPFRNEIGGRWVRGRRSYEQAVARSLKRYGRGRIGFKLVLYRQVFHFIGSVIFLALAAALSKDIFGTDTALYVLLVAAILALTYQEFYVHPRKYGQHTPKGLADWFTWVMPMLLYVFLFK